MISFRCDKCGRKLFMWEPVVQKRNPALVRVRIVCQRCGSVVDRLLDSQLEFANQAAEHIMVLKK